MAYHRDASAAEPSAQSDFQPRSLTLEPAPPFSWDQTVSALVGRQAVPDRGQPTEGGGWRLAVGLDTQVVVAELEAKSRDDAACRTSAAGDDADLLVLSLRSDKAELSGSELTEAAKQVTRFLALDLDLTPLQEEAQLDPAFAPVAAALHGFHPPLFRSAFQAVCWTVVRQRTPQAFAVATMERLTTLLGEPSPQSDLRLFPSPESVTLGRSELLAATNNLRKVGRLVAVAERFVGFDEAWLRSAPYDEALRWLKRLHGVGAWSAEQVMWRGLGRHERAPWLDTGALAAVSAVYTPGLTLVHGEARRLAASYGSLQGVWIAYLKARERAQGITG